MRSHMYLLASAPLALAIAACSSETVVDDPSDPEQIAAALENLPTPQAGEYTMTGELIEFDVPGATEEETAMVRGIFEMGLKAGQSYCMDEEMAEAGFKDWINESQNVPDGCEFTSYETSSNTIKAELTCDSADGTSGTINLDGTVSETKQDMRMEMNMINPAQGPEPMRMVMETTTERVGECAS